MCILSFYIIPTNICVFSKTTCGYCKKTVQLLQQYNIQYQLIELDKISYGRNIAYELKAMTGQTTVPNIFIYGKHIGGYSELQVLHNNGELKKIIENNGKQQLEYNCEQCGKKSFSKILECNCLQQSPFSDWGSLL
jgi:glutaredoxin 3